MRKRLLVVDDEKNIGAAFVQLFKGDYNVDVSLSGSDALAKLEKLRPDLVFLDINMPEMDGMEVLKEIVRRCENTPVVMMTAYGTIETAVEAMKLGAADYIQKPFSNDELRIVTSRLLSMRGLQKEVEYYRKATTSEFSFDQIVGASEPITKVKEIARKVSMTESTVFIAGESGTGKELLAAAIHYASHRSRGPFIAVNCAAIPEDIIESELFGHKKGSFTGAIEDRIGKFQMADEGTIFLDEVGDMSLKVQAKILRVLEDRKVTPVGGTKPVVLDVRVIAATNKNIEEMVGNGSFREDLYYRLNVVPLRLPPLRERKEDIPHLVDFFIRKFTHGDTQVKASDRLVKQLSSHDWSGNVRELRNFVERMLIFASGDMLDVDTVPEGIIQLPPTATPAEWVRSCAQKVACSEVTLHSMVEDLTAQLEKEAIRLAMMECGANISRVANMLGLSRQGLHDKLKRYCISAEDYR